MKRLVRGAAIVAAAGAMGIALTVGGVGHAIVGADTGTATTAACPAPQGNRGAFAPAARANGTIAAISGATFTLTGQNNTTYTVTTDANTHFEKLVTSSVGAIAVGDMVMAQGTTSGNTFAATTITDNGARMQPQGNPGGNGPSGPGANAPGGPGGNGQPSAQANGTPSTSPANCAPQGQQRPPQGQPGQQGPQGQQPPGPNGANDGTFAGGIVQQVSGTTLTLGTRDGKTITVTTDSATKVTTQQQGTFTDLQVGDQVMAMAASQSGAAGDATAFTATMVSDRTAH